MLKIRNTNPVIQKILILDRTNINTTVLHDFPLAEFCNRKIFERTFLKIFFSIKYIFNVWNKNLLLLCFKAYFALKDEIKRVKNPEILLI